MDLLQGECFMLRVRHRLPEILLRVYTFDEVHVVFVRHVEPTGEVRKKISSDSRLHQRGEKKPGHPLLVKQETAVQLPAAAEGFDTRVGWNWFHLLPGKTGPVVSQDIVDPARQGLVTVAGHLAALLRVLQVQTAHSSQTQRQVNNSDQMGGKKISRKHFRFSTSKLKKHTTSLFTQAWKKEE